MFRRLRATGRSPSGSCPSKACDVGRKPICEDSKINRSHQNNTEQPFKHVFLTLWKYTGKHLVAMATCGPGAAGSATRVPLIMSQWCSTPRDARQRHKLPFLARTGCKAVNGTSAFRPANTTSIICLRHCQRDCPRPELVLQSRNLGGPKPRLHSLTASVISFQQ